MLPLLSGILCLMTLDIFSQSLHLKLPWTVEDSSVQILPLLVKPVLPPPLSVNYVIWLAVVFVCVCACVCTRACVYLCVCVYVREREWERCRLYLLVYCPWMSLLLLLYCPTVFLLFHSVQRAELRYISEIRTLRVFQTVKGTCTTTMRKMNG